jgi:hypothetical protein
VSDYPTGAGRQPFGRAVLVAALADIGGVWLVWLGWREHPGWCGSVNRDIARLQDQLVSSSWSVIDALPSPPRASDSYQPRAIGLLACNDGLLDGMVNLPAGGRSRSSDLNRLPPAAERWPIVGRRPAASGVLTK